MPVLKRYEAKYGKSPLTTWSSYNINAGWLDFCYKNGILDFFEVIDQRFIFYSSKLNMLPLKTRYDSCFNELEFITLFEFLTEEMCYVPTSKGICKFYEKFKQSVAHLRGEENKARRQQLFVEKAQEYGMSKVQASLRSKYVSGKAKIVFFLVGIEDSDEAARILKYKYSNKLSEIKIFWIRFKHNISKFKQQLSMNDQIMKDDFSDIEDDDEAEDDIILDNNNNNYVDDIDLNIGATETSLSGTVTQSLVQASIAATNELISGNSSNDNNDSTNARIQSQIEKVEKKHYN